MHSLQDCESEEVVSANLSLVCKAAQHTEVLKELNETYGEEYSPERLQEVAELIFLSEKVQEVAQNLVSTVATSTSLPRHVYAIHPIVIASTYMILFCTHYNNHTACFLLLYRLTLRLERYTSKQ